MLRRITKLREADSRLVGVALIVLGLGWVSLQPLASEFPGSILNLLSSVVFGSAGIGAVHIVFGLFLLGNERLERSVSFAESVLVAVIAFIIGSGTLYYWEFLQSGSVRADMVVSFPIFACYVAAWGFPLGVATTHRQRRYTIGCLCAIPAAVLVVIPLLILLDGGWGIAIAMVVVPVILALIPIGLLLALPLLMAGWSIRSQRAYGTHG